jgi:uncharacterized protein (DUF1800 family)
VGAATVGGLVPRGSAARALGRALAMRRSDRAVRRLRKGRSGLPALPSGAVVALNRMGFGPRPGDLDAFNALGATDAERLAAYVAQQLDPASIDDSAVEARIAGAGFESVGLDPDPDAYLAILWDWYVNGNSPGGHSSSWPRDELVRTTFLRATYSQRQLQEILVEFWRDHFNVNTDVSSWIRATVPHLDAVIRLEAFGNFRVLLEAVARSPAMLRYLDNYTSSNAGPNENFSRELFELHGLGAENYLGILPQSQVPVDGDGRPIGYVDADVFESVRAFTGWSFSNGTESDGDTGLFYYRGSWHDRFQKFVLGVFMPQDQPDLKDGHDVLDAIAEHPGTGRYLARKLCRRLIADDPPQSVIDAAAAVFTALWQAPDQIEQVLQTILLSPEFLATWGEKTKRPFETAVSAMRAGGADFTLRMEDDDTNSFLWRYEDTGQRLFRWPPPNGFPDVREAWNSMTPRVMGWKLGNWLIDFDDDNENFYLDIIGQTPGSARTANQLADYWIDRVYGRPMEPDDRTEIVEFMANGFNPDFDLDFGNPETTDRLRAMVGLLFMAPEFLWR